MARSQNGWEVLDGYGDPRLVPCPYITGKLLRGDVAWIFGDFNTRYHNTIRRLDERKDDWAFAPRPIKGTNVISNHASGTAIDLNASAHPQFRDTMNAAMEAKIRALLRRYRGAIRWGGDYRTGRLDQMHFEINVTPARLAQIVAELKGGKAVEPTRTPPKGKAKVWPHVNLLEDGDLGTVTVKALQTLLAGIDLYGGKIDGDPGPMTWAALQTWLAQVGFYHGRIDGDPGILTRKALQKFLDDRGHYAGYIDGKLQSMSVKALQDYLNSQARYYR